MPLPPDYTGFSQLSTDNTTVFDWSVSMPFSVAPATTNAQSQILSTPFPEIPIGTYSNQVPYDAVQEVVRDPYLPLQHASHSLHVLPRTTIASFDNSVRAAQCNEQSESGLSGVCLRWSPTVVPAAVQSFPSPPPPPTLAPRWFELPQKVYKCGKQWNFEQSDPIPFNVDGFPGINLENALHKKFKGLDDRDDRMFQNAAGAISCRFLFIGYPDGSGQISTFDWKKNRVRIVRSKLVYEVAKQLNRYLKSMAEHTLDESVDQQWKIGEGFMRLKNMYLVGLVPVSRGSFQPNIWIRAP